VPLGNGYGTSNMPKIRPFMITYPWRNSYWGGEAIRQVERLGAGWAETDVGRLLRASWTGFTLSMQHRLTRVPAIGDKLMQLRVQDAFGSWENRIGKRRRAAFEAMLLADDFEAMDAAYAYADTEYVRMRDNRMLKKYAHKKEKLEALTVKLCRRAREYNKERR
jgi:hypothetical protein